MSRPTLPIVVAVSALTAATICLAWLGARQWNRGRIMRAHRWLMSHDRYYRLLREQAEQEERDGMPRRHAAVRAALLLLEHLHETGRLTRQELALASAHVRAGHEV